MPIKANAEIEATAGRLAALRGQSGEEGVAAALRAELAREPNARQPLRPAKLVSAQRGKVARILEMVRSAGPNGGKGEDRTAFIYDDRGLPSLRVAKDGHRQFCGYRHFRQNLLQFYTASP